MNALMTSLILGASVILEVYLELKGIKVPAIVYLLSGFAVRHIIGGDTVKDAPTANVAPKTVIPVALLILSIAFFSGCASVGMNASCGHVTGNEITIPYVGGKAEGNAYACHMGCVGFNCPKPDYIALQTLTSKYIEDSGSAITTTLPMTVTLTSAK